MVCIITTSATSLTTSYNIITNTITITVTSTASTSMNITCADFIIASGLSDKITNHQTHTPNNFGHILEVVAGGDRNK